MKPRRRTRERARDAWSYFDALLAQLVEQRLRHSAQVRYRTPESSREGRRVKKQSVRVLWNQRWSGVRVPHGASFFEKSPEWAGVGSARLQRRRTSRLPVFDFIWRWRKRKTRPGVMTGLEGVANPGGHAKKRKGLRDFLRGQGGRYRGRRESPRFGSGDFGAGSSAFRPCHDRNVRGTPVAGPRIVPFRSVRLGVM